MDNQQEVGSATITEATTDQQKAATNAVDQPTVENLADKDQQERGKSEIAQEASEQLTSKTSRPPVDQQNALDEEERHAEEQHTSQMKLTTGETSGKNPIC